MMYVTHDVSRSCHLPFISILDMAASFAGVHLNRESWLMVSKALLQCYLMRGLMQA